MILGPGIVIVVNGGSGKRTLVKALAQRFLDLDRELTELRIQQDR